MYYINKNTIIWEKWCDRARKSSTCAKQWNSISLKKILQMSIKLIRTFITLVPKVWPMLLLGSCESLGI